MKTVLKYILMISLVFSLTTENNLKQMDTPNMYVMPRIQKAPEQHIIHNIAAPSQTIMMPTCPCAAKIHCQPCGAIVPIPEPICPCAPKPHCPTCPPLSLLHEIASKKV
jgi:hypothetical protein